MSIVLSFIFSSISFNSVNTTNINLIDKQIIAKVDNPNRRSDPGYPNKRG